MIRFFDTVNAAVGVPLFLDWVLLFAQVTVLAIFIVREVVRRQDRNLFTILVPATLLVLVQGQDWWVMSRLHNSAVITQLNHVIGRDAARLANLYLTVAIVLFVVGYMLAGKLAAKRPLDRPTRAPRRPSYGTIAAITLGASIGSFSVAGGVQSVIDNPGRAIAGQTLLLVAVGLGKIPALAKLSTGSRPSVYDSGLLFLTFAVTLLNSRFLAIFIAVQCGIVAHYCWRPLSRRVLMIGAAIATVVLVGYGLYRDFAAVSSVERIPTSNGIVGFLNYRAPTGLIDWFYSLNVEGFTGFAGILTADEGMQGGIQPDYGISSLSFATHLVPNAVRTDPASPIKGISDYLDSAYPYKGSVVPPGFEQSFGGFGLPGVLTFGCLLGYATKALDSGMRRRGRGRSLLFGVLSVQILQVVRGTFAGAIFFGLADGAAVGVFLLLSRPRATPASVPLAQEMDRASSLLPTAWQ